MRRSEALELKILIDEQFKRPCLTIHTDKITPEVQALIDQLGKEEDPRLLGYDGGEVFIIDPEAVVSIRTEGHKIVAVCDEGTFTLKNRLYEIEEHPPSKLYVRISNSEIVNFKKVKSLDLSITGTITLKFKNGDKTYVSRRYVEKIKSHLGI
jgi:Response regulator of the LytR/AlgR family